MRNLRIGLRLTELDLTQAELGRRTGLGSALVSRIIRRGWIPDVDTQRKIAEILKKPAAELFPSVQAHPTPAS